MKCYCVLCSSQVQSCGLRKPFCCGAISTNRGGHLIFDGQTIPTCIFPFPELPNRFRRFVQPFTICQQRNQFNGTKKLHRVRVWPTQWPQFARADENRNIFRRAVQQLGHLSSEQPGRQVFRRPRRHCCLRYVVSRSHLGIGILQAIPSGPPSPRRCAAGGWPALPGPSFWA